MFVQQVVLRATGRTSSCSFEGQYAPRSPDPRTNDESTGPRNSEPKQYEDRSNTENTDLTFEVPCLSLHSCACTSTDTHADEIIRAYL